MSHALKIPVNATRRKPWYTCVSPMHEEQLLERAERESKNDKEFIMVVIRRPANKQRA